MDPSYTCTNNIKCHRWTDAHQLSFCFSCLCTHYAYIYINRNSAHGKFFSLRLLKFDIHSSGHFFLTEPLYFNFWFLLPVEQNSYGEEWTMGINSNYLLNRQGAQQHWPESPTVIPPGMRVYAGYIKLHQRYILEKGCPPPQWHVYLNFRHTGRHWCIQAYDRPNFYSRSDLVLCTLT